MSDQKQDPLMLALTAMASLPQWPEFVKGFKDRRRQWLEDTKGPQVYQNHAELVAVARSLRNVRRCGIRRSMWRLASRE